MKFRFHIRYVYVSWHVFLNLLFVMLFFLPKANQLSSLYNLYIIFFLKKIQFIHTLNEFRDEKLYLRRTNTDLMEKLIQIWSKYKEIIATQNVNVIASKINSNELKNINDTVDKYNQQVILYKLSNLTNQMFCFFFSPVSFFVSLCLSLFFLFLLFRQNC